MKKISILMGVVIMLVLLLLLIFADGDTSVGFKETNVVSTTTTVLSDDDKNIDSTNIEEFSTNAEEIGTTPIRHEPYTERLDELVEDTLVVEVENISTREITVIDGAKYSIPKDEIMQGIRGFSSDPKDIRDKIPSIDSPKFLKVEDVDFLNDENIGLGLSYNGVDRFYPYKILVRHELVNDILAGEPLLISYCPLCGTGIVFERTIGGEVMEFGVSGFLWQSNVLMYNRASTEEDISMWSQVLGEAVVGTHTGEKLTIVTSDIATYGMWKKAHPETQVLSTDTGIYDSYERDPYGSYYTDESTYFPTTNKSTQLHSKELVLGIEYGGVEKAYVVDAIPVGETVDSLGETAVYVIKNEFDEVRFEVGEKREPLESLVAFWFSWYSVHPETELYQ